MEARLALEEERPDTVASLLRTVGAGLREYRGAITMLVGETLAATTAFAPRYHLLRIAGDLLAEGETATAADLLRAATAAEEPELRVEATRGLAAAPPDTALTPLLEDPWPGVREAAARAIGRRGLDAERAALARLYAVETWPRVRAAAAEAFLGGSAPWPGDDVARRLLSDSSPIVRERAVNLLDARDDDRSAAMLEEVAGSRTSVPLRERALAALARRCHPGLKPLVVRIVEASVQEDASVGDQRVALEAIRALGAAAPPGIRSLLEEIVREAPFEPLRAAAIAALGEVGEPEARAAIEPYLRHPDPLVAEAATAALRLIEEGRAAARCGAP
jgi:HEAT repeat protein